MNNAIVAYTKGVELISNERWEQINRHKRTIESDREQNKEGQLAAAASMLAVDYPVACLDVEDVVHDHCPEGWDEAIWEKMVRKPYKDRLVIAGALIAAELDRLE